MAPSKRSTGASSSQGGVASKKSMLKQGSLFSFFNKKSPPVDKGKPSTQALPSVIDSSNVTSTTTTKVAPTEVAPTEVAPTKVAPTINMTNGVASDKDTTVATVIIGCRIEVYWPDDDEWYAAKVSKHRGKQHYLEYDDGQSEWIDLSNERIKMLEQGDSDSDNAGEKSSTKRRRIQVEEDDDEEEFMFDDNPSEDDGSVYNDDGNADDDDVDEDLVVTDDDKDDDNCSPSRNGKTLKRKKHANLPSLSNGATRLSLSQFKAGKVKITEFSSAPFNSSSNAGPKQITPSAISSSGTKTPLPSGSPPVVRISSQRYSSSPQLATNENRTDTRLSSPPMFIMNEVNPAGSHVHNHLKFLQSPKDIMGRSRDHPEYDSRTLQVKEQDWIRLTGKPMTNAVKQWWDLKSQYFDTVLLFKTGKLC